MPLLILVLVLPPVLLDTVVAPPDRSFHFQILVHVDNVQRGNWVLMLRTTTPLAQKITLEASSQSQVPSMAQTNAKTALLGNIPIKQDLVRTTIAKHAQSANTPIKPE